MKRIIFLLLMLISIQAFPQSRLVMDNNARMVITNGAYLVIDNSNANAILDNSSNCGIISEGENNRVRWNIGTATGAYLLPFYDEDNAVRIPYTLNVITGGTGSGNVDFSTFDGSTWDNNTYRPSMVTNTFLYFPPSTTNNSDKMADRFWLVNALNYTTKPAASMIFTYVDAENTAVGNTINESLISAKRFNTTSGLWSDMTNNGTANTGANTVTTTAISSAELFTAWTLIDPTCHIGGTVASSNSPQCEGNALNLNASGGDFYSWTGPNSYSSSNQNPVINPADATHNGTYTVIVSNTYNCRDTLTVNVVINTLTAEAGPNQSVSNGSSTTLAGSATGGSGNYSYNWSPAASLVNAAVQNPQTVSLSSTTTYFLTVTDITTGCFSTDQVVITISGSPLSANVAANPNTICQGSSSSLYSNAGGGSGTYTYIWSSMPAGFSSTLADPVVTPTATTTYYVTVNDGSVSVTSFIEVLVNPTPSPSASSNSPVCVGSDIELYTAGGSTYLWNGPNGFTSTDQNAVNTPAELIDAGTYTVTITNEFGCSVSSSTLVTINPTPSINIGSNSPVCVGGSINLTVTGGDSWSWLGPNSFASSDQNPVITGAGAINDGVYTVNVTSSDGCTATDIVTVDVNPGLTVTPTSNSPLCEGQTLQLNLASGISFSWSGPGSWTSTNEDPQISSATISMSGDYYVTVTDANGCTGNGNVNVIVNAVPVATVSNNSPFCEGGTLLFTAGGGTNYLWSGPNSFVSTLPNPSIGNASLANAGTYSVTVSNAGGCSVITTTDVTINTSPTVNVSSNSPVCDGETISLSSLGGGTYAWTGPGSFSSTDQNPSINSATVAQSGVYTVIVTGANACTATIGVTVEVRPFPVITCDNNNPACPGDPIMLLSSGGDVYLWSGPNGFASNVSNPVIIAPGTSSSGNYYVTVSDNSGCSSTGQTTVTYPIAASISGVANQDPTSHMGAVDVTVTGGTLPYQYNWSNGATSEDIADLFSGIYILTITDAGLCAYTDTFTIEIPLVIPNAITPNEDAKNDDFEILNIGAYQKVTIQIFSRWGTQLFIFDGTGAEYANAANRWDGTHEGKNLPMGSYLYIIKLDEMEPLTGAVILKY